VPFGIGGKGRVPSAILVGVEVFLDSEFMSNSEHAVRTAIPAMTNIAFRAFIVSHPPEGNREIGLGLARALNTPRTRKDRREIGDYLRIRTYGWNHNQNFLFWCKSSLENGAHNN
jgi:hypothetical protein